jgi:hypothetical protein
VRRAARHIASRRDVRAGDRRRAAGVRRRRRLRVRAAEIGDRGCKLALDLRLTQFLHLPLSQAMARDQGVEKAVDRDIDAIGREPAAAAGD